MSPIQNLVLNRLAEENLTYRDAAMRSQGLVSHATINQIALGKIPPSRLQARTLRGLALALNVTVSEIEKAVAASGGKLPTEFKLPKKADKLTPKQRTAVLAYIDALLDSSP